MSRNSEVLFSTLPSINIQRSIMDQPQDIKTTFNVGELIPFYVAECLPSDSVKIRTNKVIRLQTLLTPLMDNLYADFSYWFVPNRLTWNHWKQFMGENTDSAYLPETTYRPPRILAGSSYGGISSGDILDYFGLPLVTTSMNAITPVSLPLRAYWLIWNEFWRDQNLQNPINVPLGDSDVEWKDVDAALKKPLPVNRLHNYFSSALIAPAKNADGSVIAWSTKIRGSNSNPLPNSGTVPVFTGDTAHDATGYSMYGDRLSAGTVVKTGVVSVDTNDKLGITVNSVPSSNGFEPTNLYANTVMQQYGITVPNLRQAFQMQKFLEREASHGSRYQETLLSHFTVRAQDSRLQRPEYLGGNRIPLNVQQVINTAQQSGEYLGDLGAMSLTVDSHYDVEYSCQEHGYIIGLVCVRYKNNFSQGFNRSWFKEDRFDYAWPEFAHLTDQPIFNWEIFATGAASADSDGAYLNGVFGYQERYAEYKFRPDLVTGEMRPGISNSLASWHLGDYYTDKVYLSDDWLKVSKAPVDRALAVTSNVSNQIFADFYVESRWTRPLPLHSNPGFADHF